MKIELRPSKNNLHQFKGLLIKGDSPIYWLTEIERISFKLDDIFVYPIPDITPNSIWGCMIDFKNKKIDSALINNHQLCQCISDQVFIPEYTTLYPPISEDEFKHIFLDDKYIFHTDFGFFKLEETINWQNIIRPYEAINYQISKPEILEFIPKNIYSIRVETLNQENELNELMDKIVPNSEKIENKPLSIFEKTKLYILRSIFNSKKDGYGNWSIGKKENLKLIEKIIGLFSNTRIENLASKLEKDLEDLEKRNSSEMDKLIDLLRKNPELALKYAIPIDNEGTSRGDKNGSFYMSKLWSSFDLFSNARMGGGSFSSSDQSTFLLQLQYQQTAEEFIKAGDFEKAAFIYMKLLKNHYLAATTLEKGELYSMAATVYLKYIQNKLKAAECFEKAKMIQEAIQLYIEINSKEKVGDLYMTIGNKKEAYKYYQHIVDDYLASERFVSASLLLRNKMDDTMTAQSLLIKGWRKNRDAYNCLNNYLENIRDKKMKMIEIEKIYMDELNQDNKTDFLNILKTEFKKDINESRLKDMAYELISSMANAKPEITNYLSDFNKDSVLTRDIWRFKSAKK